MIRGDAAGVRRLAAAAAAAQFLVENPVDWLATSPPPLLPTLAPSTMHSAAHPWYLHHLLFTIGD